MLAQRAIISKPTSLGRYQITGVLGEGAMGMVYKAFDPLIERTVAVKTVNLRLAAHEVQTFTERFYREAKAAGGLNHPNIVTIYDVAESNGVAYIAMELLEGLSLRQIIDARSRPPIGRTARIVAEVADALAYAHDHGVIHRDVKPANIVLTKSGLVKITDFGIAQLPATSNTQPGLLIGSPCYMSPEQIEGALIDGRCDIFSLGTVLYELLTGRTPFNGKDLSDLMYRILHETPVPLSRWEPTVTTGLETVIEKALAKNPDDRFQYARDFARTLRSFQTSPAVAHAHAFYPPTLATSAKNTGINSAGTLPFATRGRRKNIAFVGMGIVAGSIFASVAVNQFTVQPAEFLPVQMRPAAATVSSSTTMPLLLPLQMAHNEKPAMVTVIPPPDKKVEKQNPPRQHDNRLTELNQQLKQLRQELDSLKTQYTDLHPDVMNKKRHIQELEKQKRKYESS